MKLSPREMILIALFAALTAIGAFIKIPTPFVPFTLQFLFCAYSGVFLGGKHALYAQLLYVGTGLIGIPIFTNGGGPAYVLQPTFGYLLGFIACAFFIGKMTDRFETITFTKMLPVVLGGLFLVYLFGIAHLYGILNFVLNKPVSIYKTLAIGFFPFITFDIIHAIIVSVTSVYIVPILKRNGLMQKTIR